jgi:hypothetical protein
MITVWAALSALPTAAVIGVLSYVFQLSSWAPWICEIGVELGERLRNGVKAVQVLIRADPQRARSILKQGMNKNSADTIWVVGFGFVDLELVAVVAVEPIVGTEPQKSLLVLQDVIYSAL